jgi:hypothetical protein
MRRPRLLGRVRVAVLGATVMLPAIAVGTGATTITASAGGNTRLISSSGTVFMSGPAAGSGTIQNPEIRSQPSSDKATAPFKGSIIDAATKGAGNQLDKSNSTLKVSFDGLNHVAQRFANNTNQFSLEPPDQGLCVGNGSVMEIINDVTQVYNTSGVAVNGVTDLNTFFGFAPAIVRATGTFGPFVTDPSCLFDKVSQRWFADVLTLEVVPTGTNAGKFTGLNHLDVAVSKTSDPTGAWTVFHLPVQDDGTAGTPKNGCSAGPVHPWITNPNACIGDYPHLGSNADGVYITTNEYSLFGPEFRGAQVYAFSKSGLLSGTASVTQFDTHGIAKGQGQNGFTLWPSTSPNGVGDTSANGTEWFMSSNAAAEATDTGNGLSTPHPSRQLLVWALTNTKSLHSPPDLHLLTNAVLHVKTYAPPPPSNQPVGSTPLRDCLNIPACSTFLNGVADPFAPEPEYALDSNDTRMQQVEFADGRLTGALDTALTLKGQNKAGIEWFIVQPEIDEGNLHASVDNNGYFGLAENNLTYPAIGVNSDGKGVMAFTVVGEDHFPSAGYALFSEDGAGKIHIASEGKGPADGFSGYTFYNAPNPARPRWGDYGAAVPAGNSVWIASEYIGQTCTLAQYLSTPVGACLDSGGNRTRTSLANWDTRISRIEVG